MPRRTRPTTSRRNDETIHEGTDDDDVASVSSSRPDTDRFHAFVAYVTCHVYVEKVLAYIQYVHMYTCIHPWARTTTARVTTTTASNVLPRLADHEDVDDSVDASPSPRTARSARGATGSARFEHDVFAPSLRRHPGRDAGSIERPRVRRCRRGHRTRSAAATSRS